MRPRGTLSWHWLWLLFLLLGVLAALQFRWTGEVSRAEKGRLERSLRQTAQRLGADFDLEVTRLFVAFQARGQEDLAERVAAWRESASWPDLLAEVLRIERREDGPRLERLDEASGTFVAAEWSPELAPVERMIQRNRPRFRAAPLPGPILFELPALVIGGPGGLLVLRLDLETLQNGLLPALIDHYFPGGAGQEYDFGVFERGGARRSVFLSEGATEAELRSAPAVATLLRVRRFPELRTPDPTSPRRPGARPRDGFETRRRGLNGSIEPFPAGGEPPLGESPGAGAPGDGAPGDGAPGDGAWSLRARHHAGSLETVVARLRLRNLAVSIGILTVLGASGALLIAATRRAQALARQQIEFVAGLTHELNTPLAAIESASANLVDGIVAQPDKVKSYGELIRREGRRLSELVGQALELAGVRSGYRPLDKASVDLGPLLDEVVASHRFLAEERGAEVIVEPVPEASRVIGDPAALSRVFSNLLANALKYGNGRVSITTRRAGDEVRAEVRDNGPGLAPEDLSHLFEPFYRGRAAREGAVAGSGIGLHLVRELVTRHGGRVTAACDPGGSVFTVTLPAAGTGS